MACPTCTRLRFALPEDVRMAVLEEERLLATLLSRIEERHGTYCFAENVGRIRPTCRSASRTGW